MRGFKVFFGVLVTFLSIQPQALSIPVQEIFSPSVLLDPYPSQRQLHFNKNAIFKLLIISDTHLLDDQDVPGNRTNVNRASTQAVESYLKMENPDFVVHLGDIVSGEVANSSADVVGAVRQILTPMVKKKIPFATTKGNHDNDKYSTHAFITDVEKNLTSSLSYTRKAPAGIGGGDVGSDNYWIPIYKSANQSKNTMPSLLLWFFDSRSGKQMISKGSGQIDDWVDSTVATWIKIETEAMQKAWTQLPPSLLFVHIPLHASNVSQNKEPYSSHVGGIMAEITPELIGDDRTYPGLNYDSPVSTQGGESDTIPYNGQDRAFLDKFMKSAAGKPRVHGIVSGHDHGNDWCAPGNVTTISKQIVPLCFAKHSGFGGYDNSLWNHGARVFQFNLSTIDTSVDTYIRFFTGEKRYEVSLSDEWANLIPATTQ